MLLHTTHQLSSRIAHCFVNSLNLCPMRKIQKCIWAVTSLRIEEISFLGKPCQNCEFFHQTLPQFLNSKQLQLEMPQIPGGRHSLAIRLETDNRFCKWNLYESHRYLRSGLYLPSVHLWFSKDKKKVCPHRCELNFEAKVPVYPGPVGSRQSKLKIGGGWPLSSKPRVVL